MKSFNTIIYEKVPVKTIDKVVVALLYAGLFLACFNYSFEFLGGLPVTIGLGAATASGILYMLLKHKMINPKSIGTIEIEADHLSINGNKYRLKEIKNLNISYAGYKGETINTDNYSRGISSITFEKDGMSFGYRFLVESAEHRNKLSEVMHHWYANRLLFKEYDANDVFKSRTFGLMQLSGKRKRAFMQQFSIQAAKPLQYQH